MNLLQKQNIILQIDKSTLAFVAEKGFDPVYGARPLKRVIQTAIENPLAQSLLNGQFQSGNTVEVKKTKDGLSFERI